MGTFDFFVVLKAEEVLQFGEVCLMACHEVVDIVNSFLGILIVSDQSLVSLFCARIACQQENFVDICESLKVSPIELEHLVHSSGQLSVQAEPSQLIFWRVCLSKVFIVEVVEATVLLLRHIAHAMESLNIPRPIYDCLQAHTFEYF